MSLQMAREDFPLEKVQKVRKQLDQLKLDLAVGGRDTNNRALGFLNGLLLADDQLERIKQLKQRIEKSWRVKDNQVGTWGI
jgi:hypothetical protein